MLNLTPQGQTLVQDLAQRYGVSQDAVATLFQALIRGGGRGAQFTHPELGGRGQWMPDGMVTVGDMNAPALKAKVEGLCTALAAALAQSPQTEDVPGLYIPDAARTTGHWWPFSLGAPSASGSQNHISYAYFSETHRLAVEIKGHVTVYDTQDYQISGLAQQQGDTATLTLITQKGLIPLESLPVVDPPGDVPEQPAFTSASVAGDVAPPVSTSDEVLTTLERLAGLKDRGILTAEEFTAKKAELLSRL